MSRSTPRSPRSERRSPFAVRRGILLGCFVLAGVLIVGKATKLQVLEHEKWVTAAEEQHRERIELPARRGAIYDRKGVLLALSQEMYQVSIAPSEVEDRTAMVRAL